MKELIRDPPSLRKCRNSNEGQGALHQYREENHKFAANIQSKPGGWVCEISRVIATPLFSPAEDRIDPSCR